MSRCENPLFTRFTHVTTSARDSFAIQWASQQDAERRQDTSVKMAVA